MRQGPCLYDTTYIVNIDRPIFRFRTDSSVKTALYEPFGRPEQA